MDRWTRGSLSATVVCALVGLVPATQAAQPLEITKQTTDRYFTPNGDGHEDVGRVEYGLSQAATVDVTIKAGNGEVVRKPLDHVPQPESYYGNAFEWDGTNAQGAPAPDGAYTYEIRATGADSTVVTVTGRIGILRAVPGQLTSPAAGASLAGQATARFVPTPGFPLYRVAFSSYNGDSLSFPSVPPSGDGSYASDFDSALMHNGANRVQARISWSDGFNCSHFDVVEAPVTVTNPVRFRSVSHDEAFSPNGDGVDVTKTTFTLANDDADVKVKVLDAYGTPVPDGEYEIDISATNEAARRRRCATSPSTRSRSARSSPPPTATLDIPGFELGVEDASLSYKRDADDTTVGSWGGGAKIRLPRPGLTKLAIDGYIAFHAGEIKELRGGADGLNVFLGEGFFLQRLGASLFFQPFGFGGNAGVSFGPQVMGKEAGSLDGKLTLMLEGANSYEGTGELQIAEVTMATGHVSYTTGGALDFGGDFTWEKLGVGLEAGVDGWVSGITSFNAHGKATVKVPGMSVGGEAVLSSKGIAGCRQQKFFPDVGFGYGWGSSAPHIFAASCDVGEWMATKASARAATLGTLIPPHQKLATFAIRGNGAPPRVTLTAPDGSRITTPAGGGAINGDDVLLFQNPADSTTYVAVAQPAGGSWQIDTLPGSVGVTGIRHALALPEPKVTGKVVAKGAKRTLRYTVRQIAGQKVQFAERVPGGRIRVLGTARGARGTLKIKPEPGARGKRRIFALLTQYDLPRDERSVTSYTPPKSASGKVQRLRLTARKGKLKATWKRVAGAKAYRVAVRVSDGRRLLYLDQRKPSLTVTRVTRGMKVTVQVRADGLLGGSPPNATRSIKVKR